MRDVGEQHGQIVGILQAGVHTLPADRRMYVPGVAGQKDRSHPELRRDAVMDPVCREPVDGAVGQAEFGVSIRQRLDLGDLVPRCQRDEPSVAVRSERERDRERRLAEPQVHRVFRDPVDVTYVGDPERRRVGCALERQVEFPAHRRSGTVGPDAPPRTHASQRGAVTIDPLDQRLDPAIRLIRLVDDVDQAMSPPDVAVSGEQGVGQQLLVAALFKDLDTGKPGGTVLKPRNLGSDAGVGAANLQPQRRERARRHLLGEPELVVDLHRAGMHC